MAQRTLVQLVDDLDGSLIPEGQGETVRFSYREQSYELDLSSAHVAELDEALSAYIDVARRAGGRPRKTSPRVTAARVSDEPDPKAVRSWARANGIDVSSRGRIHAELVAQFKAAGN